MTMRGMNLKILHVESDSDRRCKVSATVSADCTVVPAEELVDLNGSGVKAYIASLPPLQIWGQEIWNSAFGWLIQEVSDFDLVFLHTSNRFARAFLDHHAKEHLLNPEIVLLYSGDPQKGWQKPWDCTEPSHFNDVLDWVQPFVAHWIECKNGNTKRSVADVLEAIHQESIWRQRWFTTALLAAQPECSSEQIANVFTDVADDTKDLERFLNAAFWKRKHRTMAGPSFVQDGNPTPLWSAIQDSTKSKLTDQKRECVGKAAKDILEMLCK